MIRQAIGNAAHLLPAQGPITTFVHHNPLHHFETLPFDSALEQIKPLHGNHMLLSEQRYHQELDCGRILADDLKQLLRESLEGAADDEVLPGLTRWQLRWLILNHRAFPSSDQEVRWLICNAAKVGELTAISANIPISRMVELFEQALCFVRNENKGASKASFPRHRDFLKAHSGLDSDLLVHDVLIRFCSTYLDQGFGIWDLPAKDDGFLSAFSQLMTKPGRWLGPWASDLTFHLNRWKAQEFTPIQAIEESLEDLGVQPREYDGFISATLLALRGWAGMIHQLETRPDLVPHPIAHESLEQFLAVRLLLDRLVLRDHCLQLEGGVSPGEIWAGGQEIAPTHQDSEQHLLAWQVFLVLLSVPGLDKEPFAKNYWLGILKECAGFSSHQRRIIYQKAYEKKIYDQFLSSILANHQEPLSQTPLFQAIFCIDEREESLRRHLEEVEPRVETLSGAGFFGFPMYYKGEHESFFAPLCPVVVTPSKWVREVPAGEITKAQRTRTRTLQTLQRARHELHLGSRKFSMGTILANTMGFLTGIPLTLKILFPRLFRNINFWLVNQQSTKPITRLTLERFQDPPDNHGPHLGYSVGELATMGERFLRDIGLTGNFSRLVLVMGHGSISVNNPHLSAYDCGACGGSPGGANARAIAQALNDPRVRKILVDNQLVIPGETVFLGGLHNTCNNDVEFFDLDLLPSSHKVDFFHARTALEDASRRNAHERCRRFMSAPLDLNYIQAKHHVEGRSNDLAQARPELGHATNAFCVVGRRFRSRNIFMDRRAFLASYDPLQDNPEKEILGRILAAVIPVCSGISLEFFFSQVDPSGWGCGTKLPHNPTSMLGVMDGAASDLRTGLPLQVIEIHEAVRMLFVLECTPEGIKGILARSPLLANICYQGWIRLALLDPESDKSWILEGKDFREYQPIRTRIPQAEYSRDWYQGHRENLDYALLANPKNPAQEKGVSA